ncbi:MAG: acyltransferase [Chryseolinea sp.]
MLIEPNVKSERRYELDWLRASTILVLLFFHACRIFDTQSWHVKNGETSGVFGYWLALVSTWRMPLLFFISGAGTFLFFRKSSAFGYIIDRFKRLVIPLAFSMIFLLPIQAYYEHIAEFDNYWDFYKSVANFIPYYKGNLSLYHLWFLQYLFLCSVLIVPVLLFLRSPQSGYFKSIIIHPVVLLFVPPLIPLLARFIFLPEFQGRSLFAFHFAFFVFGILFSCNPNIRDAFFKIRRLSLVASMIMLVLYSITFGYPETQYFGIFNIKASHATISVFFGWFTVLAMLGYGKRFLNYDNGWRAAINEGLYPFFILHQTVMVVIGYYICQLSWGMAAKFWTILLLTLLLSIVIYLLFIRPFNVARFFFGMKSRLNKNPGIVE